MRCARATWRRGRTSSRETFSRTSRSATRRSALRRLDHESDSAAETSRAENPQCVAVGDEPGIVDRHVNDPDLLYAVELDRFGNAAEQQVAVAAEIVRRKEAARYRVGSRDPERHPGAGAQGRPGGR